MPDQTPTDLRPLDTALYLAASSARDLIRTLCESDDDRVCDLLVVEKGPALVTALNEALNGSSLSTRDIQIEDAMRSALEHLEQDLATNCATQEAAAIVHFRMGLLRCAIGSNPIALTPAATLQVEERTAARQAIIGEIISSTQLEAAARALLSALTNLLKDMEDTGCINHYRPDLGGMGVGGAVDDSRAAIAKAEALLAGKPVPPAVTSREQQLADALRSELEHLTQDLDARPSDTETTSLLNFRIGRINTALHGSSAPTLQSLRAQAQGLLPKINIEDDPYCIGYWVFEAGIRIPPNITDGEFLRGVAQRKLDIGEKQT